MIPEHGCLTRQFSEQLAKAGIAIFSWRLIQDDDVILLRAESILCAKEGLTVVRAVSSSQMKQCRLDIIDISVDMLLRELREGEKLLLAPTTGVH